METTVVNTLAELPADQAERLQRLARLEKDQLDALLNLIELHPEIKNSVERERAYRLFIGMAKNASAWIAVVVSGVGVFTDVGRTFIRSFLGVES